MRKIAFVAIAATSVLVAGCAGETSTAPLKKEPASAKPAEGDAREPSEDTSVPLEGSARLGDEATVTVSGVKADVSGEWDAPANTPFVKFTVKLTNDTDKPMPAHEVEETCTYGKNGTHADAVITDEIDGWTNATALPGRSVSWTSSCELPKGESVAIQFTHFVSGDTVIFEGKP